MHRLLSDSLPTWVTCGEKKYRIYTDFRRWVEVERILFEEEGSFLSKLPELLALCYPVLPENLEDAVLGMADFYAGGVKKKGTALERKGRQIYSFSQDAALIYAGFYQQYGIDLMKESLHWFQFKALLLGLDENTRFCKVVHYRSVDLSVVKNEEQKRFYQKMKQLYRLRKTENHVVCDEDLAAVFDGLL